MAINRRKFGGGKTKTATLTLEVSNKRAIKILKKAKFIILVCEDGESETFLFDNPEEDGDEEEEPFEELFPPPKLEPKIISVEYIE